ncbi:MAG: S-adenosylmethionine:tRNA ribosyltransferase-isomerase, partial [Planctomycetota bacterium]|nr:S-adenosylmethionine:tRNA ribosyltransferase-isomerase [Planctomycetota bacterium]
MKSLTEYDYDLPKHLIAQHPTRRRGDSRMLLVDRQTGAIEDLQIADLPNLLKAADSLVLNDTRVIPARLRGIRDLSGGKWEGLFLQLETTDQWRILSKTRGKLRVGETVSIFDSRGSHRYSLQFQKKLEGGMWLVQPDSNEHFLQLLDTTGSVPLPPYIRGGDMQEDDREKYQTVYAEHPGAVAAPTAGLHFNQDLLDLIERRGTTISKVTLHVGIGTFRPIEGDNLDTHLMHSEWGRITPPTV